MTTSMYINRSHALLSSIKSIAMRLCHLKNKLITPHHFLQDHCYFCLSTSMPKRPAVPVLFFFYLCHTKGNRFPLPLIKIAWFHNMPVFIPLLLPCLPPEDMLLFIHSLSKKTPLWEEGSSSWPNPTVALHRTIFSGTQPEHLWSEKLNISGQDMENSCCPSHQAPSPQSDKLLTTFYLFHPALLQVTKPEQKGIYWFHMQSLHT